MWGDPEVRTYMCRTLFCFIRDSTCAALTYTKRSMVSELLYIILIIESLII